MKGCEGLYGWSLRLEPQFSGEWLPTELKELCSSGDSASWVQAVLLWGPVTRQDTEGSRESLPQFYTEHGMAAAE